MQACRAVSDKGLLYTSLYIQQNLTLAQYNDISSNTNAIESQIHAGPVNPAASYIGEYISSAYKRTLDSSKSAIYNQFQVGLALQGTGHCWTELASTVTLRAGMASHQGTSNYEPLLQHVHY